MTTETTTEPIQVTLADDFTEFESDKYVGFPMQLR